MPTEFQPLEKKTAGSASSRDHFLVWSLHVRSPDLDGLELFVSKYVTF